LPGALGHDLRDVVIAEPEVLADERAGDRPRGGLLGLEEGLRELADAGGRVRVFGDTDLAEDVAADEFAEAFASIPMPCSIESTPAATSWPASEMVECTATRAPAW